MHKKSLPIFTVDFEGFLEAIYPFKRNPQRVKGPTFFLLDLLDKYRVRAAFYVLGVTASLEEELVQEIKDCGHVIRPHGYLHTHWQYGEESFRSPYWDTTPMPWPPSGGFFFRFMPFWYVKWAVKKSGVFWLHPHDLDPNHPRLRNPLLNWKRHVGQKTARAKLDRLLSEVKFDVP